MSETALRVTPAVNIDEFERRLRATGSLATQQEDPLAELARLLGADDLAPPAVDPPKLKAEPAPALAATPAPAPRPVARSNDRDHARVVNVDFGDAVAGAPKPPPVPAAPPDFHVAAPAVDSEAAEDAQHAERASAAEEAPRPRRRVGAIAVLVLIGAVGVAGAWLYRSGAVPGLSTRAPPLIMAASGPTRVQPPSQETVSSPNDIASLIGKEQPIKPAAATLTSSQEQPVDLNERAKAQASAEARAAAPPQSPPTIAAAPLVIVAAPSAGSIAASAPASTNSSVAAASSSSAAPAAPAPAVIAEASPTRSIAPITPVSATASNNGGGGGTSAIGAGGSATAAPPTPFPEPRRVKTVLVRPDGSVIAGAPQDHGGQQPIEPATEQPVNPPKPVVRPAIDASTPEPATPKLDLPPKPGKSTTRVPIAKIDTTAATATSQSPEAPVQVAANSQREAAAKKREAAAKAAAEPPVTASPQEAKTDSTQPKSLLSAILSGGNHEEPQTTATVAPSRTLRTATAEVAPANDAGAYFVQLAAPATESEAQSVSNRLRAKYAGQLGGLEPSIHKASIKDKTVYRVRVGGSMSRSTAVALCEKLRAAGGACFLARE